MKRWLGLFVVGWWLMGVAIGVRPTVEASLMGGGDNNTDGYLSNGGFEGDFSSSNGFCGCYAPDLEVALFRVSWEPGTVNRSTKLT